MQVRSRPSRTCTKKSCVYAELFASDDEGSDCEAENDSSSDDSDESYDAASHAVPVFDKQKGEDNWVGRRIVKTFGEHGDFDGIVFAVDDDANKPGYRLFAVHYFDDPDDGEEMWPEELFQ